MNTLQGTFSRTLHLLHSWRILGKTSELVAGFLLAIGFFTRIATIIIICTFIYITFFIGTGKIWYEDQYPLLFALFGWAFFFFRPRKMEP